MFEVNGEIIDLRDVRRQSGNAIEAINIEMAKIRGKNALVPAGSRSILSICGELESILKIYVENHVKYVGCIKILMDGYGEWLCKKDKDFFSRTYTTIKAELVTLGWMRSNVATISNKEVRNMSNAPNKFFKREIAIIDDICSAKFIALEMYRTALDVLEQVAINNTKLKEN